MPWLLSCQGTGGHSPPVTVPLPLRLVLTASWLPPQFHAEHLLLFTQEALPSRSSWGHHQLWESLEPIGYEILLLGKCRGRWLDLFTFVQKLMPELSQSPVTQSDNNPLSWLLLFAVTCGKTIIVWEDGFNLKTSFHWVFNLCPLPHLVFFSTPPLPYQAIQNKR